MTKALLIIDMQMAIQNRMDSGADHVNPDAPQRIAELADGFRENGWPVLHVRHRDENPASDFHGDAPGYPPMPCAEARAGEPVFIKRTSSGFASTGLEAHLRGHGIRELVVIGAVAGFCVNSTVRAGCDLGFAMTVLRDAVIGFGLPESQLSAENVFEVTMGLLAADFATVVNARDLAA